MPIPSSSGHSFRVRAPVVLAVGRDTPIAMEDRLAGSLVAPTGGTVTLYDRAGVEVWSDAVSVVDDIATQTVPAADITAALGYGQGLRLVWELEYTGEETQTATQAAIVARYALHCPCTQQDLEELYPGLAASTHAADTTIQGFIDTAWASVIRGLLSDGKLPEAIVNQEVLLDPTREQALALYWRWASTMGNVDAAALSERHERAARSALASARSTIDANQDGVADGDDRVGMTAIFQFRGAPTWRAGWWPR